MSRVFLFLLFIAFLPVISAQAQSPINPDSDEPLEITADDSLEWHRNDFFFQAKKNVKAKQGATTLLSELLMAKYREGKQGGMDIYMIQADKNVEILSADSTAYGQRAVYDVDQGLAVMTGDNLKLVSTDQVVTARDKFQYWVNQGRLEAVGKAVALHLGDKLEADKLIANFEEDATGKRTLKTLEAIDNVVITTPTEVLMGEYAIYKSDTNIAEIQKNVRVKRGPNILEGTRAQVNLNTNVSKIFGSVSESGRVRGVFYPGSEEKPVIEGQ